ncbi:MAG: DEAD/DEAH box helicase, partial [Deltaproteobacteria bacterium]|nr:DEAD/DEAH box helicase [Deltaproteobacteria bacterium]
EAVRQKLLKIAASVKLPKEIDGTTEREPVTEPPSAMERLRFALIKDGPKLPGGRYVGMETAPVTPWPHQEIVARRLIETWPYSYLMCDEVGLGKTIEAGLAIRSLVLSGLAKRVMIAAPASLTRQWQREMASKFFLGFGLARSGAKLRHSYIYPLEEEKPSTGLYKPDQVIVSTGLICRKERLQDLKAAGRFDIVLLDEAHYARRKNPSTNKDSRRVAPKYGNLYRYLRDHIRQRTESLWLATATPMQLDWIEAFDLFQFSNRVGAYQYDPSLTWTYYESLGDLVRDRDIHKSRWDLIRKSIQALDFQDPFYREYLDNAVIDGRIKAATRVWLEKGRIPSGRDRKNIRKLIFSASPLSRVMLRHTRPLLEIYRDNGELGAGLAKREILTIRKITFSPLERKAYDELQEYCEGLKAQIDQNQGKEQAKSSLGFYLSFLRLRFSSSMFAIKESIRRRRERVIKTLEHHAEPGDEAADTDLEGVETDDELDDKAIRTLLRNRSQEDLEWERDRLAEMYKTLEEDLTETPSKMQELLTALQSRRLEGSRVKQTVVFTKFYDTLQDIVRRLRKVHPSMLIGTYSGQGGQYVDPLNPRRLQGVDREEIKHRFLRGEIDVLICTDAAAEGLNLQTADLLVNFDLPWNPMKVEQRIGRIDRIGQKHERVYVLNLCYVDSAEERVYGRLLQRLAQAQDVVGSQQVSMLPVYEEDFRNLASGDLSPDELEEIAKERIRIQKQRSQSMEIPPEDLHEIYVRLREDCAKKKSPVNLETFWRALVESKHLRDLGCLVSGDQKTRLISISGIGGVRDGVALTVDRGLFEKGAPDQKLHFATYGDPVFDTIVAEFEKHGLPDCIQPLSASTPDTKAELRAYAVACFEQGRQRSIRLVKSWQDLSGLDIDEDASFGEQDLAALQKELERLAREEFDPTVAVERLEEKNIRAARAQEILNLLSAHPLIRPIPTKETDNFWHTINERYAVLSKREQLEIPNLPVQTMQKIAPDLLFDVKPPQLGDVMQWTAPIFVVLGATDAASRLADSMKAKRSELTIGKVQSRIDREIKKSLKSID